MTRRPAIFRFFLLVSLGFITACQDFSVIINKAPPSPSLKDKIRFSLDEAGHLTLDWSDAEASAKRHYEIYMVQETIKGSTFSLTDATPGDDGTPVVGLFVERERSEAPMTSGIRLDSVIGNRYRLKETLNSEHYYLIQVLDKASKKGRLPVPVLVIKASFPEVQGATAAMLDSTEVQISWQAVPGATAYDICAADGSILASTTETRITLGDLRSSYWIRPKRGSLVAQEKVKVVVAESPVKIESISSIGSDGLHSMGDTLEFKVSYPDSVTVYGDSTLPLKVGNKTVQAIYKSGSGTKELTYVYIIQEGDDVSALEPQGAPTGDIIDSSGLTISSSLPSAARIFPGSERIAIDTIPPKEATSIAFNSAASHDGNLHVAWVASTDAHFSKHRFKLCADSACSSSCQNSSETSGHTVDLTSIPDGQYYACVQGVDAVGLASDWASSLNPISVDATIPAAPNPAVILVSASSANGYYTTGDTISVTVKFSKVVTVNSGGDLALLLETGSNDRSANYVSGSGTDTLRFDYTVQAGDTSADLNTQSTAALSVGVMGSIKDSVGHDAILTLPPLATSNALAAQKAIVVDTMNPPDPSSVGFAGASSNSTSFALSFNESSDPNLLTHDVKLCTQNDCATGCTSATTTVLSPVTLSGVNGTTYYGCVRANDEVGLTSHWTSSLMTITVDTSAPTISNVTSTTADGYYKTGDTINIQLTFSETVTLTNTADIHILMESGGTDHNADYASGSGSNTLNFTYPVQSGDTSGDFNIHDANALTLGATGTIKDAAGNNVALTLPVTGAGSLSDNKSIVIDTTAPAAPTAVAFSTSSPSASTSLALSWTDGSDSNFKQHNLKLCPLNDCSTACLAPANDVASPGNLVGLDATSYYACVRSEDKSGLTSTWVPSSGPVAIDTSNPTVTLLFRKLGRCLLHDR